MSVFQASSLNHDIHNALFGDKNYLLERFKTDNKPDWLIRFTAPARQQANLAWVILEITPRQTIPLFLTADLLQDSVMSKMNQSLQPSLFRQNKKKEALNALSQNLLKLWQPKISDDSTPFFWNPSIWSLLSLFKNHFSLEPNKEQVSDILDPESPFIEGLLKLHSLHKLSPPKFALKSQTPTDPSLALDRFLQNYFKKPSSHSEKSEKKKILTMRKQDLHFQFLLVFLEYEFIFRNHRERDLKTMIDEELKKRKDMSPEMKSKVYLKFAKYLLSKESEKKINIKKVLRKALSYQQDNYKMNHYMGLVHYNEIQAKLLAKEKKDEAFLKLVSDALKYFIKSIFYNTNLTRKFIIQGMDTLLYFCSKKIKLNFIKIFTLFCYFKKNL